MTWFRDDLIKVQIFNINELEYKGVISLVSIEPETVLGFFDGKTEIFEVDEHNIVIPRDDVDIKEMLHIYRYGNKLMTTTSYIYEGIDYMNHSCKPNCYLDGIILLKTNKFINPNEELTFDYRLSNLALEGTTCWCDTDNKCYF